MNVIGWVPVEKVVKALPQWVVRMANPMSNANCDHEVADHLLALGVQLCC